MGWPRPGLQLAGAASCCFGAFGLDLRRDDAGRLAASVVARGAIAGRGLDPLTEIGHDAAARGAITATVLDSGVGLVAMDRRRLRPATFLIGQVPSCAQLTAGNSPAATAERPGCKRQAHRLCPAWGLSRGCLKPTGVPCWGHPQTIEHFEGQLPAASRHLARGVAAGNDCCSRYAQHHLQVQAPRLEPIAGS